MPQKCSAVQCGFWLRATHGIRRPSVCEHRRRRRRMGVGRHDAVGERDKVRPSSFVIISDSCFSFVFPCLTNLWIYCSDRGKEGSEAREVIDSREPRVLFILGGGRRLL